MCEKKKSKKPLKLAKNASTNRAKAFVGRCQKRETFSVLCATDTNDRNRYLSIERAKYIGKQLMSRGAPKGNLKAAGLGSIAQFTPKETNRFCVVLVK